MKFAIFEDDGVTEAIAFQQVYTGPERKAKIQAPENFGYAKIPNDAAPDTHYIRRETMRANQRDHSPCTPSRTEVPADGVTHVTLSQMRPGTRLKITGPAGYETTVYDGSAQVTFPRAGVYTIVATAPFPALPKTLTVVAT